MGPRLAELSTHVVTNQPPPFAGASAWGGDPLLRQAAEGADAGECETLGRFAASAEAADMARLANEHGPLLRTHDAQGFRADAVEFHPAYHALMRRSVAGGLHAATWEAGQGHRPHVDRAAKLFLTAQIECGHLCPITMTHAAFAALRTSPHVAAEWGPRIASRRYDSSMRAPVDKQGLLVGMGMTEKQGGTDVRANTTRAEPLGQGLYRIVGHKWFLSAPMSDAFLLLAQAPEGPTCLLAPRLLAEGDLNGIRLQRLKDKLGNRSNASAEAEFDGTIGQVVGEPGDGIRTILEMVTLTRLDCAVASAGLMRGVVARAVHHARHRRVFGAALIDQPVMARVLADMALDVAGASALALRLARAFDRAPDDAQEAVLVRVLTPAAKYWCCKIAPALTAEAMECFGGNGYVEDWPLARAYREAPVNAIWEGSGSVMALDLARIAARHPDTLESAAGTIGAGLSAFGAAGVSARDALFAALEDLRTDPGSARVLAERLAVAAAAGELARLGVGAVAEAFAASRLWAGARSTYGHLPARHGARPLVEALCPEM